VRVVSGAICKIQSEAPSSETDGNTKREQIERMIRELRVIKEVIAIRSQVRRAQVPTCVGAAMFWKLIK
jgi:hypothetical protein